MISQPDAPQQDQGIAVFPRVSVMQMQPGRYQPRKKFEGLDELADSIKAQGILQPILLRPLDDSSDRRYEIVAGERRWRAAILAFGETLDNTVPVMIRHLTDQQAKDAALTENVERRQMTPLEEAEACAHILADCEGDHERAASRLGMKVDKLRRRLGLMYCIPEVREALAADRIDLGHAELLAGLRKEAQKNAIEMLLSADKLPTVAALTAGLQARARDLSAAIFDKEGCVNCPHNSGTQQALFASAITAGNCTNAQCFEEKTEGALALKAKALEDEYQVVRIIRAGDNYSITALKVDGDRGVGEEQAKACKACKNFGAAVSALPDALGAVYRNQCMDTTCNTRMVATNIRAKKQLEAQQRQEAAQLTEQAGTHTEAAKAEGDASSAAPVVGKTAAAVKQAPAAAAAKAPASYSRPVVEYREKVWRAVLQRVTVKADAATNRCILIALLLSRPSHIDNLALANELRKLVPVVQTTSPAEVFKAIIDVEAKELAMCMQHLAAYTTNTMPINEVVGLLKALDVKLLAHWMLNAEFLQLLTKNEIEALCSEIGLDKAMGKDMAKALAGKKDELIKAVMNVKDFDYASKLPRSMRW